MVTIQNMCLGLIISHSVLKSVQFSIASNSAPQANFGPIMSQFSIANNSAPQASCVPIMNQFSITGNSAPQASCVPIMNQFSIAFNSASQANCGPTISKFSNVEPFVPSFSNRVSDSLPSQINAGKSFQSMCFSAAEKAESSSRFQMPFVSRPISHVPQSFTFDAAPKPLISTSTLSKPLPHNISAIKTPVYVSHSDAVIQPKPQFVQTLSHDKTSSPYSCQAKTELKQRKTLNSQSAKTVNEQRDYVN